MRPGGSQLRLQRCSAPPFRPPERSRSGAAAGPVQSQAGDGRGLGRGVDHHAGRRRRPGGRSGLDRRRRRQALPPGAARAGAVPLGPLGPAQGSRSPAPSSSWCAAAGGPSRRPSRWWPRPPGDAPPGRAAGLRGRGHGLPHRGRGPGRLRERRWPRSPARPRRWAGCPRRPPAGAGRWVLVYRPPRVERGRGGPRGGRARAAPRRAPGRPHPAAPAARWRRPGSGWSPRAAAWAWPSARRCSESGCSAPAGWWGAGWRAPGGARVGPPGSTSSRSGSGPAGGRRRSEPAGPRGPGPGGAVPGWGLPGVAPARDRRCAGDERRRRSPASPTSPPRAGRRRPSAAVAIGYRTRAGMPFAEVRATWEGDARLATDEGAKWPLFLLLGYRFDVR